MENEKYPHVTGKTINIFMPDGKGLDETIMSLSDSLSGIGKQQESIIKMLLNMDGTLIRLINEPTEEQMMIAVKQNGMAIQYMLPMKQTDEMKMAAIESNPFCFEFVYEPTMPMWLKALQVEMPEDEELAKKHPVKVLKRIEMSPYQKKLLYTTFLDQYPSDISAIADDICEMDEADVVEIFEFLFKRHGDVVDADKCPRNVIGEIIDNVMEDNPRFLRCCPIEYWTTERMIKLLEYHVCYLDDVCHVVMGWDDISAPIFIKHALDICKNESDMRYIIIFARNMIPHSVDYLATILESKNAIHILDTLFVHWNIDRNGVEYILDKFPIEEIFDNVRYATFYDMTSKLSLFKRIKYRWMANKHRKETDKRDRLRYEELTNKPQINGVELNREESDTDGQQ
jgi:hypothetical protein